MGPRTYPIRPLQLLLVAAVLSGPAHADLTAALDAVADDPALAQGVVGIGVYDLTRDTWLYGRNLDKLFIPASTYKLATVTYAVENLGPDFRLATRLVAERPPDADGRVDGSLYLVGGGDPFTVAGSYKRLAQLAYEAGVRSVSGGLAIDESRLAGDNIPVGWSVGDLQYWYGARPHALNIERQRLEITIRPTQPYQRAEIIIADHWANVSLDNACETAPVGGKTDVRVSKSLGQGEYRVSGTIAADHKLMIVTRAVEDPGRMAAHIVREELAKRGVAFGLDTLTRGHAPGQGKTVGLVESEPLSDIVRRTLKYSENLAAELLLWNTGVELQPGRTYGEAEQAQYDWLAAQGLPMTGLRTADGSGLSRYNHVTPRFVVELLRLMQRSRHFEVIRDALPVAGVDGTLTKRFAESPCKGVVRAKTGWLSRVFGLAGYAPRPDGTEACFVVFFNAAPCPSEEGLALRDAVPEAIVTEP